MSSRIMTILATRSSVHPGDDGDAPHARTFATDASDVGAAIRAVVASGYLPAIDGGAATWSVTSAVPLAVVAQQWPAPRLLMLSSADQSRIERSGNTLRLRFNYHAQYDPELVFAIVRELRMHAE
jgi:hypothetical protein